MYCWLYLAENSLNQLLIYHYNHFVTAEKKRSSRTAKTKTTRTRKKPLNEKHISGFLFGVCLLLTLFLGSLLMALVGLEIPDISSVANYKPPQTTIIYDRHNKVVDRVYQQNRTVISLEQMNPLLPKGFVAAEDGRFFEHAGLDFLSVMRALFINVKEGRKSQGGSTITQQVAKSLLLTPEKTYLRKFKEAILAWRIDTLLTKEEILYIYLNQIYLGEGAYGVEAASQTYFGKHAAELTLGEVALLAGLPQAPSRYSPFKHLKRARARQRYVLNRMAADGYVSSEKALYAYESQVNLKKGRKSFAAVNGYYLDTVKKQATEIIGGPLSTAGAKIYTYLDPRMQRQGAKAVSDGVMAVRIRNSLAGKKTTKPQSALLCLERNSGRVRAMVGGNDFSSSPFNRATQAKRPAGSIFKPFVYAAALQQGFGHDSIISDEPLSISGKNGKTWRPKNYDGKYHGETTLSNALAHSYNVASVRLMRSVGVKKVHTLAKASGITASMPPDLSLALGTVDVSLLEMTAAYGVFANRGKYTTPSFISRVEHNGKTVYREKPAKHQVLPVSISLQMRDMLEGVVKNGTGKNAAGLPGITGGKTGTTDKNRDAWFVGFNGNFITGVWVGHDRNESLGVQENGGKTALPIWKNFMIEIRQ